MADSTYPKTCTITYEEYDMLKRSRQLAKEVNRLAATSEMIHPIEQFETVALCVEEMVMLLEFRLSKYNYRMDKIKLLKDRWKRIFH